MPVMLPQLQPHQERVRQHMVERCPEQPGIVLFHAVGTGKTLTALSIAMGLRDAYDCVIFCPDELFFMWEDEVQRLSLSAPVLSLEDMATADVANKLVIVDEAHFWVSWLNDASASKRKLAKKSYDNLCLAPKRLVLTGSPIINPLSGVFDLACLCNLAVGREKFPFAKPDFDDIYVRTNVVDAVVFGWAAHVFSKALGFASSVAWKVLAVGFWSKLASDALWKLFSSETWLEALKRTLKPNEWSAAFWVMIGGRWTSFLIRQWASAKASDIRGFRSKAFWKDVGPVVSTYKTSSGRRRGDGDGDGKAYPSVAFHRVNTNLTLAQQRVWWDIANKMLQGKSLRGLGISSTGPEITWDTFVPAYESYLKLARRIGVYTPPSSDKFPPKFHAMYRTMKKVGVKRCVVFSELSGGIARFASFLASKDVQNYETLTASNAFEVLDRFEKGGVSVLLLPPTMYFGITIKGARQLHVMEPIYDGMVRTQLYGRVNRYMSHAHLPAKERKVDVYVHVAKLSTNVFGTTARLFGVSLYKFVTRDSHMYPGLAAKLRKEKGGVFETQSHRTPDEVVWALTSS
jgi:hypothetical protein